MRSIHWRNWINQLIVEDRVKLVFRLTILLLLFFSDSSKVLQIIMVVPATIMLVNDRFLFSKWLWALLSLAYVGNLWMNRLIMDNHKYLLVYWVLVCFLSLYYVDKKEVLSKNARYLIVITFFFATLWKLVSHEFPNGAFMEYTLWTDSRVAYVKNLIMGASTKQSETGTLLSYMLASSSAEMRVSLAPDGNLRKIALILSWIGIILEGAICLSFAFVSNAFLLRIRNLLLFGFIIFTYQLLPVPSFGFLLGIMGIAQLKNGETRSYLLLFVSILLMQAIAKLSIISIIDFNWLSTLM